MAKQTFTTGQVLTAAQMTNLQQTAMGGGSATAKTASYTLVAADAGATVIMNSASATTITVNTSLFSAGDTVFIQNIGAGVSTITAGTATVNTASSLALAQYESGNLYFTAAGASIFSKADGAAAGGGGKVLQVVQGTTTTSTTIASTSMTATTISRTITPSAASSKVLVIVSAAVQFDGTASAVGFGAELRRDSTTVYSQDASGYNTGYLNVTTLSAPVANTNIKSFSWAYLDSPSSTSELTYTVRGRVFSTSSDRRVVFQSESVMSTIICQEIGA